MKSAPPTADEARRLEWLHRAGVLDTLPQDVYDHVTTLAAAICETPIALISLVDTDRQWFKSRVGVDVAQTARELAFCAHAIHHPQDVMVVNDASRDERFFDNPLVTSTPDIRFYAGAPIVTREGLPLGTVCVIDRRTRGITEVQKAALKSLAGLVVALIEHDAERREAELQRQREAAREAEIRAALTAAGLDLLSFVDTDYRYRYVNRCYLDYWAREREDIVGKTVPELMGEPVFSTLVKPHLDRAMAGQEVAYEAEIDFPGKGLRAVEVTYLPVVPVEGQVNGVVVRAHDIQALRRRESHLQASYEQLEHKTLELQRFIHIISHDLREPINTISNFAGLLEETAQLEAAEARFLKFVADGSRRLKTLLDDLLDLLVLDRHALRASDVDLNALANDVQDDLRSAIEAAGATVEVPAALPPVHADPTLLRIALQNLMANAVKFCPAGRAPALRIEVRRHPDGSAAIRVHDNGIGMAPEQIDKIFEPFARLNNRRDFAGSGLGLSIVRRIAELHGGRIAVTSRPGEGSCFELWLPGPADQHPQGAPR